MRKGTKNITALSDRYFKTRLDFLRITALHMNCSAVILLGICLRFLFLGLKPPHLDEGVNGWFVERTLPKLGYYPYDPGNFHGPLHFYLQFFSKFIFGHSLWTLRFYPALFGVFTLLLAFQFKTYFGRKVALVFCLLLAISPAEVFFSRSGIHESAFAFFSMLFFFGVMGVCDRKKKIKSLWIAAFGFTGMVLLKETWIIQVAALIVSFGTLYFHSSYPHALQLDKRYEKTQLAAVASFVVAAVVLFYSGFFQHPSGLIDFFRSFPIWMRTGTTDRHYVQPFYYWLKLFLLNEPSAFFGIGLSCYVIFRESNKWVQWVIFYGLATLVIYSLIPYKTPWCIIGMIWPFDLVLAVWVIDILDNQKIIWKKNAIRFGLLLVVVFSFYQTVSLNFFHYDSASEAYVYNQMPRETLATYHILDRKLLQHPELYQRPVFLFLRSCWPFPWLLEKFEKVIRDANAETDPTDALFIICSAKNREKVEKRLNGSFYVVPFITHAGQKKEAVAYFDAQVFSQTFHKDAPTLVARLFHSSESVKPYFRKPKTGDASPFLE